MKIIARLCILFIFVFSFQGCIIQSYYPFFTPDALIESPIATGEWSQIDVNGKPMDSKPWVFSEKNVLTYDASGGSGVLNVNYFKIDDSIFVDITVGELSEAVSAYIDWHIMPVHTLCKVDIKAESLMFQFINYDWFEEYKKKTTFINSYIEDLENASKVLYTATPNEWMEFLKENKNNTDIFSEDNSLIFIKQNK